MTITHALLGQLDLYQSALPYIALSLIVWATYLYAIKCGFVSDDHQGLGEYDGKFQGFEYGMISRWFRYHFVGGGNYPSKIKLPDGRTIPQGKLPLRHHVFNIILLNIGVLLGYTFFSSLFGEKVAFITFALFTVSPIGTQCVAWISGIGYPLSIIWIFLILNYVHTAEIGVVSFLVFIFLDIMAINALFVALAIPAILIFLGHWQFAILSSIISLAMGLRIVRHTIKIRADEFKKQDMGNLTKINPRRFIVAVKTVLYYIELLLWPSKLGLYHEWGNQVTPDVSREDRRFFLGLLATIGLIAIAFLTPIMAIKLGILWFFAFIFIFLNWITIQQFVTERYLWIPSIGFYLIVAHCLQGHESLLYLIGGILICRTWLHLPTYDDELRFYLSNTWNYQNSETALANLGCTWIRLGAVGSALDAWHASAKANPDYDVPYANIYFHHRAAAMLDVEHGNYENGIERLKVAFQYIESCCKCSVRHFKDDWDKERNTVAKWLENPLTLVVSEKKRLTTLQGDLLKRKIDPNEKDHVGLDQSLIHISQRLQHIKQLLDNAPKDRIPSEDSVEPTTLTLPGQEKK